MPIYIYETLPGRRGGQPRQFEVKQSMNDAALTQHPETGVRIRRIIQGGYLNTQRWTKGSPAPAKTGVSRPAAGGICCGVSGCGPH